MHGDEFDTIVMTHKWHAFLGDAAYELILKLNVVVNYVRRRFNLPYWSLSKHAKHNVKNAVEFISHYEEAVARAAHIKRMARAVCGLIHTAEPRQFGDLTSYNKRDRVDGRPALAAPHTGRTEIHP